jgi:glycosyltransferase involved in cell wall biosynthesis
MWVVERTPHDVARSVGEAAGIGGGWQDALLASVRGESDLDLLVVYPGGNQGDRTNIGGVEYVEIGALEPAVRAMRVVRRWAPRGPRPAVLSECARVAADWRPDIVHVHGTESGLALVADRVAAPTMISLQGLVSVYDAVAPSAKSRSAITLSAAALNQFVRGISTWHDFRRWHAMAAIERRVLHRCLYVAGRTDFDRRVASVLAPDALYLHVGELLREPFYGPQWVCPSEPRGVPVLCANASDYDYIKKGVDTAIEAVRILQDAGHRVSLRLFGTAPDGPASRSARTHAHRLGVDRSVILSGRLSAANVVAELLAADVFLLPSRADNSPNVLCEAMALGVPCIASSAGGIPSLATDGQDALLVPPGDAYSLAGAVLRMLSDRQLAMGLSGAAQLRARARHDPETVRNQLLAAYERVVVDARLGRRPDRARCG